jgi:hypothetical protein
VSFPKLHLRHQFASKTGVRVSGQPGSRGIRVIQTRHEHYSFQQIFSPPAHAVNG